MMSEETLNNLFDQARTETLETKATDIQKWIGIGTLGILLSGLLTKTKLLLTLKPLIMISSTFVAVGIGVGTVFMMNSQKETPKPDSNPQKTEFIAASNPKQDSILEIEKPITQNKSVASENLPVNPVGKNWSGLFTPERSVDTFCMEPVATIAPISPMKRIKQIGLASNEETETTEFTTLKIWGTVDVVLIQGNKYSYLIEQKEVDPNLELSITNKGKTLEISTSCKSSGKNNCKGDFTVYVTVIDLKKIDCSGATNVHSQSQLKFNNLNLVVSGATDVLLNLMGKELTINASGASDINLEGDMDKMQLVVSGATELKADELKVKTADVDCSGASEVTLAVSDNLDVKVSGASHLEYSGSPRIGKQSVTGVSEFKHK